MVDLPELTWPMKTIEMRGLSTLGIILNEMSAGDQMCLFISNQIRFSWKMLQHTANDLSLTTASTPPTTFNSTPTTSPTPSSPQTTVDDTTVSTPTPTPEPEPQIPVVSENETLTFAAPNIQVRQSIPRAAKDKCINTLIENRKALSAVLSESILSMRWRWRQLLKPLRQLSQVHLQPIRWHRNSFWQHSL